MRYATNNNFVGQKVYCPDPRYIADPSVGSNHTRGVAVDVTLVDGCPLVTKDCELPQELRAAIIHNNRSYHCHLV